MSEITTLSQPAMSEQSGLLTPKFEARRLGAPVVSFAVKGDPRTPPGSPPLYKERLPIDGELEAVRKCILNPYDIHAACEGPGRLALIRKMSPHGMSEMTVMAQEGYDDDGSSVTSLFGFDPQVRKSFYTVGTAFAEFSEAQGLYPIVSYTYDPLTADRRSPQSVKTYHMQLVARSEEELSHMTEQAHPLAEYNVKQRRQVIDEATVVYSLAMADYCTVYPIGSLTPIPPFSRDNCANIRFRVGSAWSDIMSKEFDENLQTIHQDMNNLYADFSDATMSGTNGRWERPMLSAARAHEYIDSLDWMQPNTKDVFKHFISGLRVSHLQRADRLRAHGLTEHVYPLAGLCYGTAINRSSDGDLLLSIRPQLFGETGGTGLQFIDPIGAHVKMARGSGMYNTDELSTKTAFERQCATHIANSMLSNLA